MIARRRVGPGRSIWMLGLLLLLADFGPTVASPLPIPVVSGSLGTDADDQPTQAKKKSSSKRKKKSAKEADQAEKKEEPTSKKAPKKQPFASVKVLGEFQSIYDDNVFRFSDENLLAYRKGETPWKFGMDTYDDFILSPRLTLDLGRKVFGPKELSFRVKYTLWQYASNPNKSNDQWMFRLRQPVRAKDAVEFSYTYAPPAYVRQLSDRPPFESRAVPVVWMKFKGTRNAFVLAYSGRLSSRLSYRAEAGRVLRYYNKPFLENDNWEWNGAGTATVKLNNTWTVAGKYQYANSTARALDTEGETKTTTDDGDGSYERDLYQATVSFTPPWKLWKVDLIDLMGQQQVYYYTSDQLYFNDPTHTGRKDTVKVLELTASTKPVWGPVTLEAGWRTTHRSSTSAATVVGADDIEEDKKYDNNRVWLGMAYPF